MKFSFTDLNICGCGMGSGASHTWQVQWGGSLSCWCVLCSGTHRWAQGSPGAGESSWTWWLWVLVLYHFEMLPLFTCGELTWRRNGKFFLPLEGTPMNRGWSCPYRLTEPADYICRYISLATTGMWPAVSTLCGAWVCFLPVQFCNWYSCYGN